VNENVSTGAVMTLTATMHSITDRQMETDRWRDDANRWSNG